MKIYKVLGLIFVVIMSSYGQDLPKITPPSPEAASIAKFTEVPVSNYTGTTNISIPIYTINQGEIKLPINLSYHSRGIKVSEIASRVGIGWTLNYGGSISRQTMGVEDESVKGYLNNELDSTFFTDRSKRASINTEHTDHRLEFDMIPDNFFFNVNGNSGKFLIDKVDKKVSLLKFQDLKIEYFMTEGRGDVQGIGSFIVTDHNGVKYYFGQNQNGSYNARDVERVVENIVTPFNGPPAFSSNVSDASFYNAWHLTEIVTPNGNKIEFKYDLEQFYYYRRSYDKSNHLKNEVGEYYRKVFNYTSKIFSMQYQLKEIIFNKGRLKFNSLNDREDLPGGKTLHSIVLMDKNNKEISKFELFQSYSQSPEDDEGNVLPFLNLDETAKKRLFLDSIQVIGKNNLRQPPYKFEYDEEILPSRFSNSQDMWGYYNGADNGPMLTFLEYRPYPYYNNRRVDTVKSLAGMLKKVFYPTGGSSTYIYEQNRFGKNELSPSLQTFFPNPKIAKSIGLSNLEAEEYYNGSEYSKSFHIGKSNRCNVSISFADDSNCLEDNFKDGCKFIVLLENKNSVNPSSFHLFKGSRGVTIREGDYTLRVIPQGNHNPISEMDGFVIALSWEEEMEVNYSFGGGKRIKKIVYKDQKGKVTNEREFDYKWKGISSGRLFGLPSFYKKFNTNFNGIELYPLGSIPGSPLGAPQGNSVGYSFTTEYYGTKENNSGKVEYYYTTFKDSGSQEDYPHPYPSDFEWLRGKPEKINYYTNKRGDYQIVKEIQNTYWIGGSLFPPIALLQIDPKYLTRSLAEDFTDNEYLYHKDKSYYRFPLVIIMLAQYDKIDYVPPLDHESLVYRIYHRFGGTMDLVSSKEINHFDDKNLVVEKTLFYNYDKHYFPSSSMIKNSAGEVFINKTKYSEEVNFKNSLLGGDLSDADMNAINQFKKENQHLVKPIQKETYKDYNKNGLADLEELLSIERTIYKLDSNGLILPGEIKASKDWNNLESRITYHSYDSKGNPLEVSKADGTHIYYVWGYNQTQPIAKLENFTSSEASSLAAQIQAAVDASNLDDDNCRDDSCKEQILRVALKNLRGAASSAMVTTFTYDPLIGVTSITDPRGQTVYYEYDAFNRLKSIRDAQGNLIQDHQYHYKNQQ